MREGESDAFSHTHEYEVAPTIEEMNLYFASLEERTFSNAFQKMIDRYGEERAREWLADRNWL